MVSVIIPNARESEESKRNGGLVPSFRTSPLLETPDDLPQFIQIKGNLFQLPNAYSSESLDPHLTEVLHAVLGHEDYDVHYVAGKEGNFPTICTFNNEERYAIGPRCEILHNQFGIGPLIMYLLDKAPLWIMTPHEIESELPYWLHQGSELHEEKTVNIYPDWVYPVDMDIPKELPRRLRWILTACKENILDDLEYPDEWEESVGKWPFAVCSWYGFEPLIDKRMTRITMDNHEFSSGADGRMRELKLRPKDQGQGDDPSWFVLDHMISRLMNYSDITCMPEVHEMDRAEEVIGAFKPFHELLNYISHDKKA